MTSVNIVRVKRKLLNNPSDSVTISYKRTKLCQESNGLEETIKETLEFIGTSSNQDEGVNELIQKAEKKSQLEADFKTHRPQQPCVSARTAKQRASKSHRFKLISEKRGLKLENNTEASTSRQAATSEPNEGAGLPSATVNLFDLVQGEDLAPISGTSKSGLTCNGVPLVAESGSEGGASESRPSLRGAQGEGGFVYDIYYLPSSRLDMRVMQHDLQFECLRSDDVTWQQHSESSDEAGYEDEDDENEEDNWRNDYPDNSGEDYHHSLSDDCEEDERALRSHHVTHMLHDRLKITDSDDALSSDTDSDHEHTSASRDAHAQLWAPRSSFDAYRRRVMRQLYSDHPQPDGEEGGDEQEEEDD